MQFVSVFKGITGQVNVRFMTNHSGKEKGKNM